VSGQVHAPASLPTGKQHPHTHWMGDRRYGIRVCIQNFPDWPPGERMKLRVSLVSFAAMTLYVASEQVFIVVSIYLFIDSLRKLLDTPSYKCKGEVIPVP
jgi:hypothetical protein